MAEPSLTPTLPLTASRELDALVAEKVMGWRRGTIGYADDPSQVWFPDGPDGYWTEEMVPYSTSIAAAWTVVEKLNIAVIPYVNGYADRQVRWAAMACKSVTWHADALDEYILDMSRADTAPLAICLAALKAVGA